MYLIVFSLCTIGTRTNPRSCWYPSHTIPLIVLFSFYTCHLFAKNRKRNIRKYMLPAFVVIYKLFFLTSLVFEIVFCFARSFPTIKHSTWYIFFVPSDHFPFYNWCISFEALVFFWLNIASFLKTDSRNLLLVCSSGYIQLLKQTITSLYMYNLL